MDAVTFLSVVLYLLGSILLVVLIILGIKLIITMNKVEKVVDNIDKKVNTLNGFFGMIDATTDRLALLSDKIINGITLIIKKIFTRKKGKEDDYYE